MSNSPHNATQSAASVPSDDPKRYLTVSQADDPNLPHIGLVGDTYLLLTTVV